MLKGHVFLYQIFGNEICAKVFDTFGKNASGILEGYGDSMEVTYNGSELTISSGVALICGRPVQETSSTTIDAGITSYYCKLVLTVDLDQENTSADFNQGYYEIVTDASAYPELTQDDIVNTNQGKYQFELARFTTGVSGIDNFVEAQNYLLIGKIINDMDTTEDQTTNAPSIQAVKNYVDKSILTIGPSSNQTYTANRTYYTTPLTNLVEFSKKGNKINLNSNNEVVLDNSIQYIKVSGFLSLNAVSVDGTYGLYIYKRNGSTNTEVVNCAMTVSNYYNQIISFANVLLPVSSGDVIIPRIYIETSGKTAQVIVRSKITVEEV